MSVSTFRNSGKGKMLSVCLLAVLAGTAVHAQTESTDKIEFTTPVSMPSNEVVQREAILSASVDPLRQQGDRFMRQKEYDKAYMMYQRALSVIEKSNLKNSGPAADERRRLESSSVRARKAWGMSIYEQAKKKYLDSMCEKDRQKAFDGFKEAQDLAMSSLAPYYLGQVGNKIDQQREMIRRDKGFYDNVQALIMDCSKMRDAYTFQDETSLEQVDPDYTRRKREIELLLRQAEVHYQNQQYEKARNLVEKVLVDDPYNQRSVDILNKIYKRLYRIGLARSENDALEQMAEVDWMWSQPLPPDEEAPEEVKKHSDSNAALYEKLQQTIVDKIEYDSAEIQSILENLSTTYNVQILPPSNRNDLTKKIQYLELEKMPLLDVLHYICEVAGLSMEIDDDVVKIGVRNTSDFELKSFEVRKSLISRIQVESEGGDTAEKTEEKDTDKLKDAERFADKTLAESAKTAVKQSAVNVTVDSLKNYFTPMGITFPEGSTISYDSGSGRLRMRNTPANLRLMKKLLDEIDIPPPLVLVDSKVMEVSMNVMEELGFDWVLTYTDKDTSRQFQFSGLDSSTFYRNSSSNYVVSGLKVLPNFGGNNQFNLSVSIRALDQKDRSEILSTPRLLVASGYTGKLTVAEERYFPDDWSDPKIEIVNGTSYTYTAPTPEFGDSTNVGTQFTVTPTVGTNNRTIKLVINTNLSRMTGWSSYDYSIIIGGMMYSPAGGTGGDSYTPKMKMPEFSKRTLQSSVKIYDGETVVIGGILENIVSRREDKWPLLGDVPLLGRLFTDSTYASEKVNLMVFVTARLMKGNGLPVKDVRKQGLFEFNDR